jgi:molybdopterin-guanine dinucleotide biosynthesis protein
MYDIIVQVSGKEHSGKTSLIALIGELLKEHGLENVTFQRADPQIDEKLADLDAARTRAMKSKILIREFNTLI